MAHVPQTTASTSGQGTGAVGKENLERLKAQVFAPETKSVRVARALEALRRPRRNRTLISASSRILLGTLTSKVFGHGHGYSGEHPPGADVFLDANIFIYAFTATSPECEVFLARCARQDVFGVTSYEVVNETTHRFTFIRPISPDAKVGHRSFGSRL